MAAAKPTVALVIADSSQTGAPTQVLLLARALNATFAIHCFAPGGWLTRQLKNSGITTHIMPGGRAQATAYLRRQFSQLKPALVHCHGVRGGMVGRLAADPASKIVYTEHLWTNDFALPNPLRQVIQLALLRRLSKKTHHTIAVSQAVKRFLIDKRIAPASTISVIYGAINPLKPIGGVTKPIIGTIGSLVPVKGIDILLKALAQLVKNFPELTCIIAGSGPAANSLRRLARRLAIEYHLLWQAATTPETFYRQLQIYVQPSRSESFGLATLEAMSAGIPVVAARAGAMPELIQDQKSGILFRANDPANLARNIRLLLGDKRLRNSLARSGRQRALKFSVSRMAAAHRALYHRLINDSKN